MRPLKLTSNFSQHTLKDIGNQNFYSLHLLNIPIQYRNFHIFEKIYQCHISRIGKKQVLII